MASSVLYEFEYYVRFQKCNLFWRQSTDHRPIWWWHHPCCGEKLSWANPRAAQRPRTRLGSRLPQTNCWTSNPNGLSYDIGIYVFPHQWKINIALYPQCLWLLLRCSWLSNSGTNKLKITKWYSSVFKVLKTSDCRTWYWPISYSLSL